MAISGHPRRFRLESFVRPSVAVSSGKFRPAIRGGFVRKVSSGHPWRFRQESFVRSVLEHQSAQGQGGEAGALCSPNGRFRPRQRWAVGSAQSAAHDGARAEPPLAGPSCLCRGRHGGASADSDKHEGGSGVGRREGDGGAARNR